MAKRWVTEAKKEGVDLKKLPEKVGKRGKKKK